MPKTSEDVKKGLECCLGDTHAYHCDECPYADDESEVDDGCGDNGIQLLEDALALIQQLQAENAEQAERIKQLGVERDALMHYLHSMGCDTCLYDDYDGSEPPCINCTATRDLWQFQGVQKEDGNGKA